MIFDIRHLKQIVFVGLRTVLLAGFLMSFSIHQLWSSPALSVRQFVDQGYTVNVVENENSSPGRTALLIHGLGVSRSSMHGLAVVLAQQGYRVLLPDIPGQGPTAHDLKRNYSVDSQADFLARLLESRGLSKVDVIGNSMGGHIATSFALLYKDKVQSLVLISPAGLKTDDMIPYELLIILPSYSEQLKRSFEWNNHIRRSIHNGKHSPINEYLPQVQVPTLIVWGGKDQIIPPALAPTWNQLIPNSKLIKLPEFGHTPQQANPNVFFKTIQPFLASQNSDS